MESPPLPPPQPRRHGTRAEYLADTLLALIGAGQLRPGDRLFYEDLERDYTVSRTVVREALRILEGKRVVTARPHTGTCVASRGEWNLFDPELLAALVAHDEATRDHARSLRDHLAKTKNNPLTNHLLSVIDPALAATDVSPEPVAA
jgi:DNA-binding FadR family transcriptional regulator